MIYMYLMYLERTRQRLWTLVFHIRIVDAWPVQPKHLQITTIKPRLKFTPIFALLHLFFAKKSLIFCKKKHLFFATYCTFCVKLFSPSEIIFTNVEHVFLRILVTNLRVLCFDIYDIPTIKVDYQSRLNLVSEICLVNILTFSAWGVAVIF